MVNENLNVEVEDAKALGVKVEDEMEQYLLFQCDDLRIGVRVDYVMETLINHSITSLPMLPNYISGIINLRGEVVPIISVRLRLNKPSGDERAVIVLNTMGTQIGILVDQVDQMVKMPKTSILPMPANNNQKLMCGMGSLPDGGTMLVLDGPALLEV